MQQHKLLKVIKKKLVRKCLDMIKKIDSDKYMDFWKEYSTNVKLGMIDDAANRTRLAKLLRYDFFQPLRSLSYHTYSKHF